MGSRYLSSSCIALGLMAVTMAPAFAKPAESCKPTSDEKAVFWRSLQTDLMVGALACDDGNQYNNFVHQFQSLIKTDAAHLQSFFRKKHGKGGEADLNIFVTQLANDESIRITQQGQPAYCDNTARLFQAVLALPPAKAEDYAVTLPITSEAPVRQCAQPVAAGPIAAIPVQPAATTNSADEPVGK